MRAAENHLRRQDDALVNWDAPDLAACGKRPALRVWETEEETTEMRVTAGLLDRWFAPAGEVAPPTANGCPRC